MSSSTLHWLDQHPGLYVGFGAASVALLLATVAWSFRRRDGAPQSHSASEYVFYFALFATLIAWRWPCLLVSYGYNPDESQQIAGALTLARDPVFWRAVDGHTAGPVNFYALLLPKLVGAPIDYASTRFLGLVFLTAALICAYRTLRLYHDAACSRVGVLPGILFFAFATDWDFLQLSSEHVSIPLLALAVWLLLRSTREAGADRWLTWALAGLSAGLVPWAKLQGVPASAAVLLLGLLCAARFTDKKARWARTLALGLGYAAPTLAFFSMVLATGQLASFYDGYIGSNASYVQAGGGILATATQLWEMTLPRGHFPLFLLICALATLAASVWHAVCRPAGETTLWKIAVTAVLVSVFLALAPRRAFPHYLLFLILPFTVLFGASLGLWAEQVGRSRRSRLIVLVLATVVVSGVMLANRLRQWDALPIGDLARHARKPYTDVAAFILPRIQTEDTLGMWGWSPGYYVETQLPQATRDAHTQRAIEPSAFRTAYRERFVGDLQRSLPPFFVDATGPGAFGFKNRAAHGHEVFHELKTLVKEHYRLAEDFGHARVYMRKDRFNEIAGAPVNP